MRSLLWYVLIGLRLSSAVQTDGKTRRPNIVFILTDDQDTHMQSLDYMPLTQKYLMNEGTVFAKHYCTVAICCPSRVNIWTGQLSHNTNVTDVNPPYGGYPKFVSQGYNENHLALWMQESGYNTYYVGKLFNSHTVENYASPAVKGYTGSEFLLDPFTYQYFNASMTRNGQPPVNYAGQYSPDLTVEKAYGFLEDALTDSKPFFLTVAPIAPHANVEMSGVLRAGPPGVAPRHRHLFRDYKIPRTSNFNPDVPSGVGWVAKLPKLNDTVIEYNDEFQRHRLRALQAVDEMVENLVLRLDKAGALENTYIFYSTDNGYHISQHRMHPGKECGFETDINVPMVVRGPGIPAGRTSYMVSSHTDLAPTIMSLAGNDVRSSFDGQPMSLFADDASRPEHLGIEFWGFGVPEGNYKSGFQRDDGQGDDAGREFIYPNNTYKGLRIAGQRYNLYYSVWCTNETELYDMTTDPGQMNNLLGPSAASATATRSAHQMLLGRDLRTVVDRLDALMMVLKSCKGATCIDPWRTLHPNGNVRSLAEALVPTFDAFYAKQPKVSFSRCEFGYIRDAEGPQDALVFQGYGKDVFDVSGGRTQEPLRVDPNWSVWT